ncbi:Uncharacterised protein [Vibrio anguillarum]|nr:Uncharacterised protein [Vibrio anguillarum]
MPSAITSWLQSLNINLEQLLPIAEALGLIALISIVIHLVLHRGGAYGYSGAQPTHKFYKTFCLAKSFSAALPC